VAAESRPPFRDHSLALIALAFVVAYLAWQVVPLSRRMDAVERSQLEIRDRLLAKMDRIEAEMIAATPGAVAPARGAREERPSRTETSAASSASAPAEAGAPRAASTPARARVDLYAAECYFARSLFPEDATIALLMLQGVPPAEIARRLKHSVAFVKAKGVQIEKQLAAKPDVPPEILAAIGEAVERGRAGP
jgi:hypothetical protein